jgi:hypothetical protein
MEWSLFSNKIEHITCLTININLNIFLKKLFNEYK